MPLPSWMYKFDEEGAILDLVLKPLVESYEIVKNDENAVSYEENAITEQLVWYLKTQTSISALYQRRSIDIVLRPKEQVAIDEKYEPDIKFNLGHRLFLHVEAKRIYAKQKWSASEYLSNDDGIGRILSGKYSRHDKHAGMLGYIQNGDFQSIIENVRQGILKTSCKKIQDVTKINNCTLSVHTRSGNDDIIIYHLFFYFTG
jgi:hypothetical protein